MDATEDLHRHHFVLVHGACHGAWSWYKLKPLLESAGHRVTVLDLAGSGTSVKTIYDVRSFAEYNEPLMEAMDTLGPDEKVVLVGHSLGGLSAALVADRFPKKVSVAVFLAAFLPDTVHPPSYVVDQRWMIENTGVEHVVEIPGADHMPMLSKVQELSECLKLIAATYA